jgi:cell wall-associated NlpC family hydrolase
MARSTRLVSWAAVALAVPATVAFSPVHPADAPRWAPQLVSAARPAVPVALAAVPGPGSAAGPIAVRAALTRLGDPYVWAAAGPHAFDCSGLVVWSFQQAGVSLPHSSQQLAAGGRPVALDQMRPGDVITYYSSASHVGLYVGGGKMVHASTYGVPVAVAPIDNAPIYNVRRYG